MRTEEEVREKVDALTRDLGGRNGAPVDMLTLMFKKGALTLGKWVLNDESDTKGR